MRNFDMNKGIDEESIPYDEFDKAVDLIGLVVIEEVGLKAFERDLDALVVKGQTSTLTADEVDAIEKGRKDISKLTKKTVIGKDGKKKTVYVKAGAAEPKKEGKAPEDHAKDTRTHKLEKYAKEGKDEGLKKIAKDELNKRKSEESKKKYTAAQKPNSKQAELDKHAKNKKDEDDAQNPVVGKTGSGKFVFKHHENGGHEGFTSKDHADAVNIHKKLEKEHRSNDVKTLHHGHHAEANIHSKQAATHAAEHNKKKSQETIAKVEANSNKPSKGSDGKWSDGVDRGKSGHPDDQYESIRNKGTSEKKNVADIGSKIDKNKNYSRVVNQVIDETYFEDVEDNTKLGEEAFTKQVSAIKELSKKNDLKSMTDKQHEVLKVIVNNAVDAWNDNSNEWHNMDAVDQRELRRDLSNLEDAADIILGK